MGNPSRRNVLIGLAAGMASTFRTLPGRSGRGLGARASGDELTSLTLGEAADAVRARGVTPTELTKACLDRIARLDPRLNSFITVTAERALADARRADAELGQGRWRGPLHGIPIALKDNIDTAGVLTTAGSAVFADRVPAADASVVCRLKAAGAILLGKLNLHEFALGTTSAISHYGPVRNPWDLARSAGGSSGGCGAAVAAGLCYGAVGTDTGGSIRIPASACGIVGLKPTYGIVSTSGVVPVSHSFDHVGPMCRTVRDAALLFSAMTDHPVARAYRPDPPPSVKSLRVGVVRTTSLLCDAPVAGDVQVAFDAAVEVIRSLVASLREVQLRVPDLGAVIDAEAYAFHAPHLTAAPGKYDPRTLREASLGKDTTPDAYSSLLEKLKRHRADAEPAFSEVDVVVLPTLPQEPLFLRDATAPFSLPACTFAFSLGGWPAISIPAGFSRSGLPIGLLIGGPALAEPLLLALAEAYERVTNWEGRRPPVSTASL
jgi:aspartyl-tRNA(Asn)/glutamyl-tRNA(Gln) amidotransferase subunit A